MYIKELNIKNLGPIENIALKPRFNESGHIVPIAIVGQNGAGKSLSLSVILDAITEARRKAFSEIKEVSAKDYLRLSSKRYVREQSGFSYSSVVLSGEDYELKFDEVVSKLSYSDFQQQAPEVLNIIERGSDFNVSGFYKNITVHDHQKENIRKLSFLYFPYFRYEPAYWLSEKANVDFASEQDLYGHAAINAIRTNIIEETKRWILNVLLDRELYEKRTNPVEFKEGMILQVFHGYNGPNTAVFNHINQILTTMFKAKDPKIISARLGIGQKRNRTIAVFTTKEGQTEKVVAPDISQLSSGELMTLGIATEIIRSYEVSLGQSPTILSKIKGIVLIDEIDLHLHISYQKSVLPSVLRLFPNVQFVMTTHSPFFLLGMAETGDIDIYNFPSGDPITIDEFSEFKSGYDIFINENKNFQARFTALKEQVKRDGIPLIVTEGKTDWKHIKIALELCKEQDQYQDLEVEFFEFDSETEMGDTKLSQMCEHMATLPQQRKIIFVFDRDNPAITKKMSGEGGVKEWGNKVSSVCLPVPEHRTEYKNLSIELYYTDSDLCTVEPKSQKRLWFTNEIEIITNPTSGRKIYRALNASFEEDELNKKVFDQPADKIVDEVGVPVGLSKSAFTDVIACNLEVSKDFNRDAFKLLFDELQIICNEI